MSGRLSALRLLASPPGKGPHRPGAEMEARGELCGPGCPPLPQATPPDLGKGYKGYPAPRGERLCLRWLAGCAHGRGCPRVSLCARTHGHPPLRPRSPRAKTFSLLPEHTHTSFSFFFFFHYERLDGVYSKLLIQRENRSR